MHMAPCGLRLLLPVAEGLQAEVEHPLGLTLLLGDEADDILVQSYGYDFGMYVGGEAELVFLFGDLTYECIRRPTPLPLPGEGSRYIILLIIWQTIHIALIVSYLTPLLPLTSYLSPLTSHLSYI